MTAKHKLTPDEIKAHLTQEELKRIEHIRPQMTYTTTQLIESLVEERIQKVALLVACRALMNQVDQKIKVQGSVGHFKEAYKLGESAISKAEEVKA